MYHCFLIHSFTDGHLGCFQHLAIVNCAAVNIGVHRFFGLVFQGSWDITPGVELLGQRAVPFLVFWGNSILFSIVASPVFIPTNSALGFPFLRILSNICLWICLCWPLWLVWDSTSLWFYFASLWWLVMVSIFSYVSGPSVCLPWRSVCSSPLPIF